MCFQVIEVLHTACCLHLDINAQKSIVGWNRTFHKNMKRRTLIGVLSGAFAFLAPPLRGAASITPASQKPVVDRYGVIKTVYDEFPSLDPLSKEFEYMEEINFPKTIVHCKKIAVAKDGLRETWLLFCEDVIDISNFSRRSRELKLVEIKSKKFYDLDDSFEYDAKKALRGGSFNSRAIVYVSQIGNIGEKYLVVKTETCPVSSNNIAPDSMSENCLTILSRFLTLIK